MGVFQNQPSNSVLFLPTVSISVGDLGACLISGLQAMTKADIITGNNAVFTPKKFLATVFTNLLWPNIFVLVKS